MNSIINALRESADLKSTIADSEIPSQIMEISKTIASAVGDDKKVLIFGNGGSASDAQHIAAELVGRYLIDRPPLPVISLATDTSILTAVGNDYGFDAVFSRQIEALGRPGDVAFAISTSGASKNIILALKAAKEKKMKTIALLGRGGGPAKNEADLSIIVPSDSTPRIQEAHITIGHIICMQVEQMVFGK